MPLFAKTRKIHWYFKQKWKRFKRNKEPGKEIRRRQLRWYVRKAKMKNYEVAPRKSFLQNFLKIPSGNPTNPNGLICVVYQMTGLYITAWKVSVLGVILARIFPHSNWIRRDTVYLSVFSSNAGKCGPE